VNLTYEIKHFSKLSALEFHNLLKLRVEVFVIEQNCPYPEVDGIDPLCFHLTVKNNENEIIGTSRIIPKGIVHQGWSIGRLVVNENFRRKKIASKILSKSIEFIYNQENNNKEKIRIDALKYLEQFYKNYQFSSIKEYKEYDWDYIEMILN
jgi:ElaA protein